MKRPGLVEHWDRIWVRLLPKRLLTALVGWFARRRASKLLIPWFIKAYQINLEEAELGPEEYKNWVDFFSRRLRTGVRMVQQTGITSPVDGTASSCGVITDGMLIQAKGQLYTVSGLLGEQETSLPFHGGQYLTLYLSPRDYHRVHMPFPGRIARWTYIPGSLYPVNPAGVQTVTGLFTKNERLVLEIESLSGNFLMVLIGATIVGSIRTDFGPAYQSPFRRVHGGIRQGEPSVDLDRGAEVGRFEFGSTVILIFPPEIPLQIQVDENQSVRMGDTLALFQHDL